MFSITKTISGPLLAFTLFNISTASACCADVNSTAFHEQFVGKWLSFWNGNASLLNELAAPDMVMHQDRIPSATGNGSDVFPITSSEGLAQGMALAFQPYESHHFDLQGWAGTENRIAVRWMMTAVLGKEVMGRYV